MTTDAELRRLAEAACREPDRYGQANCELHETIGGGVVLSLLDRLAVAEKRAAELERLLDLSCRFALGENIEAGPTPPTEGK